MSQLQKNILKIMQFDQEIIIPEKTVIDLVDFYCQSRISGLISMNLPFFQLLHNCTNGYSNPKVDISSNVFIQYTNKISTNDYEIMKDIQEPFFDIRTSVGKEEIALRLAAASFCIKQHLEGGNVLFENNGTVTIIGYGMISDNAKYYLLINVRGGIYDCVALDYIHHHWPPGCRVWSQNKKQ